MNLNKVFLAGNLTRDPELRYTANGTALCKMGIAVNREWHDRGAYEKKKETCFVDIIVWGKQGENCSEYLDKGSPVHIEGRLTSSTWQTQEGHKRTKLEVTAECVQFLSTIANPPKEQKPAPTEIPGEDESSIPF